MKHCILGSYLPSPFGCLNSRGSIVNQLPTLVSLYLLEEVLNVSVTSKNLNGPSLKRDSLKFRSVSPSLLLHIGWDVRGASIIAMSIYQ